MPPAVSLYRPAPGWVSPRDRYVYIHHGCTSVDRAGIEARGINLEECRVDADFGRGFYTTTSEDQASQWAWNRFHDPAVRSSRGIEPVVLTFRVDRHRLAQLSCIAFVRGDPSADDFWGLVQYCRRSALGSVNDHRGPKRQSDGTAWYDVVCGPVTVFWRQMVALPGVDQFSFHTADAVRLLNGVVRGDDRQQYRVQAARKVAGWLPESARPFEQAARRFWDGVAELLGREYLHTYWQARDGIETYRHEASRCGFLGAVFNQGEERTAIIVDCLIRNGLVHPGAH